MAWTTPRTWTTGELVTKTIMDTHIRDNLNALKDPPGGNVDVDESTDYTCTATNFIYVDSSKLAITLDTKGGDVLLVFTGVVRNTSGSARAYFTYERDSTVYLPGDDGLMMVVPRPTADSAATQGVCMLWLVTGLAAGTHVFRLKWKTSAGTLTLFSGAGTSNYDLHPQFWAREIS